MQKLLPKRQRKPRRKASSLARDRLRRRLLHGLRLPLRLQRQRFPRDPQFQARLSLLVRQRRQAVRLPQPRPHPRHRPLPPGPLRLPRNNRRFRLHLVLPLRRQRQGPRLRFVLQRRLARLLNPPRQPYSVQQPQPQLLQARFVQQLPLDLVPVALRSAKGLLAAPKAFRRVSASHVRVRRLVCVPPHRVSSDRRVSVPALRRHGSRNALEHLARADRVVSVRAVPVASAPAVLVWEESRRPSPESLFMRGNHPLPLDAHVR
jgi:hypothetical protein